MSRKTPAAPSRHRERGSDPAAQLRHEVEELRQQLWLQQVDYELLEHATIESQRELELSRERYVELYDLAPIGYALLDRHGFIREANLMLAEMLGVPRNRLVSTLLAQYVLPESRRSVVRHLGLCRRSPAGETVSTDLLVTGSAGRPRVLQLSTRTKSRGNEMGLHTSILDISARRDATEAMRTMNQQLEERVAERTRDLRSLTNEILRVEERERFVLANDIHDGLSQFLVAAGLKLGNIAGARSLRQAGKDLAEARGLLEEAIEATRTLTFNLSPPVLRELGLLAAARWLGQDIHRRFGVRVTVEGESVRKLPDTLKLLLFRCLRELLVNVGKHAGAKHARVALGTRDDMICLDVIDDGRGFCPEGTPAGHPHRAGFGLFSIRERVAHLGGTMEVTAAPDKGTHVRLCVPESGISKEGDTP